MDCNPPGSPVHGIFSGKNTRVVCHFLLQGIFPTQGWTHVSCIGRRVLYHWATWEAWNLLSHFSLTFYIFQYPFKDLCLKSLGLWAHGTLTEEDLCHFLRILCKILGFNYCYQSVARFLFLFVCICLWDLFRQFFYGHLFMHLMLCHCEEQMAENTFWFDLRTWISLAFMDCHF